eukprot:c40930_g1_i1.p1 GENE.c40930_g1_i1~~c40930_g1_i1.p1  ORF type:complete len:153 (-),score=20.00 c40930_g1_i1:527-985(-)
MTKQKPFDTVGKHVLARQPFWLRHSTTKTRRDPGAFLKTGMTSLCLVVSDLEAPPQQHGMNVLVAHRSTMQMLFKLFARCPELQLFVYRGTFMHSVHSFGDELFICDHFHVGVQTNASLAESRHLKGSASLYYRKEMVHITKSPFSAALSVR